MFSAENGLDLIGLTQGEPKPEPNIEWFVVRAVIN